ncbi:hypothetical protein ACC718_38205, partial [Rhizobium ruizarguesonis]
DPSWIFSQFDSHVLIGPQVVCDEIGQVYEIMAERSKQGLAPDQMDIPALPPRTAPFAAE